MNHPEELTGYWELKFNSDPTALDVNGDRQPDWVVAGGGTFNTATLSNGVWLANGAGLNSNPGDNFAKLTFIDLRFNATTSGSWAGFSINAARSGTTCAPILAHITMQSDGTQTISVWRKLNDSTTDTLLTVPGLAAQPTDLHLVIDPAYASVAISINGVEYGSFTFNAYTSSDPDHLCGPQLERERAIQLCADTGAIELNHANRTDHFPPSPPCLQHGRGDVVDGDRFRTPGGGDEQCRLLAARPRPHGRPDARPGTGHGPDGGNSATELRRSLQS